RGRCCRSHGDRYIPVHRDLDAGRSGGDDGVVAGHIQLSGCGHPKWQWPHATSTRWAPGPGRKVLTCPNVATRWATASASVGRQMITTLGPASAVAEASRPSSRLAVTSSNTCHETGAK